MAAEAVCGRATPTAAPAPTPRGVRPVTWAHVPPPPTQGRGYPPPGVCTPEGEGDPQREGLQGVQGRRRVDGLSTVERGSTPLDGLPVGGVPVDAAVDYRR